MTWVTDNWFNSIQSFGIIASLILASIVLLRDTRSRKVSNYLSLIQYHRDIWRLTLEMPELNRIRSSDTSLRDANLSPEEVQFLTFVFLHITCSYEMQRHNQMLNIEMLKYDINSFLKQPLVLKFWRENKKYYNSDFVEFVDNCIDQWWKVK